MPHNSDGAGDGSPGTRHAPRPVTRADVARYAGVSTAVVSYVVNQGPRPVARETAARVRAAVEILGYRPNLSARALRIGSSRTLGLVMYDMANPFFAELSDHIQAAAALAHFAVVISSARHPNSSDRRWLDDLTGRSIDGLMMDSGTATESTLSYLRRTGVRCVVFDSPAPVPYFASVGSEAAEGARLVVDHLIHTHHHQRIALVVGDGLHGGANAREEGWQAATRAAQLPDGPIARGAYSRAGGYDAARRLLAASNPPSAIFASSDLQAVGVLRAVREAGLSVPGDVALVAFDGTEEAEYACPPLTVVRQPVREMAAETVRQIASPVDDSRPGHVSLPMSLVVRQSCGCD